MLKRVFHFRSDYNRQLCFMSCRLDNYESERNFIVMFLLIRYMEPLVYGDYPSSMRCLVKDRLPTFTKEEKIWSRGLLILLASIIILQDMLKASQQIHMHHTNTVTTN